MEIIKSESKRVIFLSLVRIDNLYDRGIYHDLLREFINNGFEVTLVCPVERSTKLSTRLIKNSSLNILQVKTLNIQKCNIIEKGLSTISLNFLFKRAIRKYIELGKFDLILYATPPITLTNLISWLKYKSGAKTYLLVKDIFPQNAIDMGYFKAGGPIHTYFSKVEQKLYQISDKIGCMSPANLNYLRQKCPELTNKLEVNPNSVDLTKIPIVLDTKEQIRLKWQIPLQATIFLYGGNLGKPQGVEFLLEVISACINQVPNAYFLIVGDGTDFQNISKWFNLNKPINAQLIKKLPKHDFDFLAYSCDVGLILLRKEFTIPNFPSRLLTYLENCLPILAITDNTSDIGVISEDNEFGKWAEYGDLTKTLEYVSFFTNETNLCKEFGKRGFEFLKENYNVKNSFKTIQQFLLS